MSPNVSCYSKHVNSRLQEIFRCHYCVLLAKSVLLFGSVQKDQVSRRRVLLRKPCRVLLTACDLLCDPRVDIILLPTRMLHRTISSLLHSRTNGQSRLFCSALINVRKLHLLKLLQRCNFCFRSCTVLHGNLLPSREIPEHSEMGYSLVHNNHSYDSDHFGS